MVFFVEIYIDCLGVFKRQHFYEAFGSCSGDRTLRNKGNGLTAADLQVKLLAVTRAGA